MTSTFAQTNIQTVHVMLLIAGGHQCELELPANAPLLRQLLEAMAQGSQNPESGSRLFQIPMEEGGATLYFPSESIVAIATDPPISLEDLSLTANNEVVSAPQPQPQPQPQSDNGQNPQLISSRYVLMENFLSPADNQRLLQYVLHKQPEFESSKVGSNDPTHRQSKILYYFDEAFDQLIKNRIRDAFPQVVQQLGLSLFEIAQIEGQITAHNDGHYYKVHNDNGDTETATRIISYVYYFHREPQQYNGGALRLYDSWKLSETLYSQAESFTDIQPRNNSIVFFLSSYCHEVMPVSCPSREFADSRFTFNGWIRYAS
ncbi:2OG-Fe(II) oxygenase [Phormidium sp. CCY1219]|uniref:2OG-Fe(II) oxygenase n=1 Tax=Phormidium sp. CCY1219 TaxID=2886104 RepID=UPI002D1EB931|nr:2OG-Fe(II) oxygenase [Phormidium sp. CCY1219]MEB3828532.1 2OG-Fe(II) oxygenase [Phormidium sp. CCY1219]